MVGDGCLIGVDVGDTLINPDATTITLMVWLATAFLINLTIDSPPRIAMNIKCGLR